MSGDDGDVGMKEEGQTGLTKSSVVRQTNNVGEQQRAIDS